MDTVNRHVSDTIVNFDVNVPAATAKTTVGIGGAIASYMTLNEWVALFTLFYVILQIGLLVPKYVTLYRAWYEGKRIKIHVHE